MSPRDQDVGDYRSTDLEGAAYYARIFNTGHPRDDEPTRSELCWDDDWPDDDEGDPYGE